jgi:hypothetical protein
VSTKEKKDTRIIKVSSCCGCPLKREYDGGGFIAPYTQCEKYNIILNDENVYFDMSKIHPKCQLEKLQN